MTTLALSLAFCSPEVGSNVLIDGDDPEFKWYKGRIVAIKPLPDDSAPPLGDPQDVEKLRTPVWTVYKIKLDETGAIIKRGRMAFHVLQ